MRQVPQPYPAPVAVGSYKKPGPPPVPLSVLRRIAKSRERPSINQVGRATTPGCLDAYDAINQAGRDATFFFSLSLPNDPRPQLMATK